MVKWNLDATPTGALPGQTLQPVDVLYEFDEPLIFRAEIGLTDYLLNKVSGKNGKSIYLACETNGEVVDALKEGRLSVRGAFTAQKYLIDHPLRGARRLGAGGIRSGTLCDAARGHLAPRQRQTCRQKHPKARGCAAACSIHTALVRRCVATARRLVLPLGRGFADRITAVARQEKPADRPAGPGAHQLAEGDAVTRGRASG